MIQQDTMEQIIRSQQEQIADLLETNRSLVESNGKLLEQTDALQQKIQELLRPLYDELVRLVVGYRYVQADETTVRVISKGKGKADKEYLWMVRAVMEKLVIFHYDDGSRSGQTIRKLLKDFKGYLQSDGYSAYNVFEGTEGVCLIACLAHIRHHFEMALEENRSLAEHALKMKELPLLWES